MILGIPSAAHREALLRETAGGGRVPTMIPPDPPLVDGGPLARRAVWRYGRYGGPPVPHEGGGAITLGIHPGAALLIHHPTDPEAGAMGLARLAWVAGGAGAWFSAQRQDDIISSVTLHTPTDEGGKRDREWSRHTWSHEGNNYRQAGRAAEAIGLVCVHLGLLERVERAEVPEEGGGWREWATAAARALDYAAKDPACSEPEWLQGAATTIRGALRSPSLGPRIQRPVSVTLVDGPPLPGPPCERCQGADPDCRTCGGMGCPVYVDGGEG